MKISCCMCIYDDLFPLNTDQIIDLIVNCSLLFAGFMIIESDDEIYISCREIIVFCCEYYSFDESDCPDVIEPCLDAISFGSTEICQVCMKSIVKYLSDNLVKVK